VWTKRLAAMVRGSGARVGTHVGFPLGTSKATIKAIEATGAVKDGADEIEVVAHLPYVLALDVDSARAELMEVVRAARAARREVVVHVIFETALLWRLGGERAVECACRATRESGCDGIVTATGLIDPAAAGEAASLPEILARLKRHGEALTIKAAVVDDPAAARAALEAGADRVGTTQPLALLAAAGGA